eukprot:CAMPEP_0170535848 /NCGR_PEP_ID=MMETSP0209-20121228/101822_1 /TAXON_ID=665100 ORGANISM="Litonotus pictus, Strain P1" /NCGR_SAMPLE_ID=MMETSP0209 /ASSEMBLY_ACC=CAM_ASM_000301 /LENGTH=479 /DNA_ID=CAMNT_0010837155 /DNA_START=48 /DNA_END=1488 /DNA_ORIENTATION=+
MTLLNKIFLYQDKSSSMKEEASNNTTKVERTVHRALVILDDWNLIESHSMFWDQLRNVSYDLEFKMVDDMSIKLDFYGEQLYESIILCVPTMTDEQAKNSELSLKKILKHFDEGHNLMIIADKNVNSFLRSLVTEFGVDFDDYDSQVKDSLYLHSQKSSLSTELLELRSNEIIVTKNVIPVKNVFHYPNSHILYEGIGLETDPHNQYLFPVLRADENSLPKQPYSIEGIGLETDPHNQYLFPVLRADENSYSVNSKSGLYYNFGEKIKLVAGYQGRNNKRVTITGSTSLCSNKFYFLSSVDQDPLNSPNAQFCKELIQWNTQKSGVLKYDNERHHRKSDGKTLDIYRIKDELEYMVDIYEYDLKSDSWKPYLTDDLQIEYTMMDPFYRLQLKMLSMGKPTYTTSFKSPDKWGVFKFIIDYKRVGYSYLDITTKCPLKPFRHDEYERFLSIAYPYYISVFSVIFGFVIFVIVFFFSSNKN